MEHLEVRRSRPGTGAAAGCEPAGAGDEGLSTGTCDRLCAPVRELARRSSGTDEVLLLWHPASNRVELCVRDLATEVCFHLEIAPGNAIDAFYHPYAYAARRTKPGRRAGA